MSTYPASERHRPGVPWRGVLFVAALALMLALVLVARESLDPIARRSAQAAADHAAAISAAVQPVDIITAALWRLIPPALVIAASITGLLIAWRRFGWRESIGAHYLVKATQAERQQLPPNLQTLTYHNAPRNDRPAITAPAVLTGASEEREDEDAPTFRALLDSGRIGQDADGRRQPLILGYQGSQAITGDWRSLYSSGLGGLQGSGKTWTAAYLLAQSAAAGARLVVCDPHAGDEESLAIRTAALAPAYLCDVAEDERAIFNALKLADGELQRRKNGHPDRTPIIVAVDEWSSLRRGPLAELLPAFIEDFSTEGRKLNCHVMLLGQRWDKSSVGDFRNTLASSYVHRMRSDEARMMTGLRASALPGDTLQLPPGVAYLLDTRGSLARVQIPYITPADMLAIGQRLAEGERATDPRGAHPIGFQTPARKPAGNPQESSGKAEPESTETAARSDTDPQAVRVLALFFENGVSVAEIVKQLWPEASGGRAYNERRAYVEEVIRTRGRKG